MAQGSKQKYTNKQKRQAEHIEEGYEARGVPEDEAQRRAWATVNKMTGGGKKPGGSGRGKRLNLEPARRGGSQRRAGSCESAGESTFRVSEEGRADSRTSP